MCTQGSLNGLSKIRIPASPLMLANPRQISEEDRKWFQEAMEAHTEDIYKRLRGIKDALESKADAPEDVDEKLRLLDDLTEVVENIDYARGRSVWHSSIYISANASICFWSIRCHSMQRRPLSKLQQDLHANATGLFGRAWPGESPLLYDVQISPISGDCQRCWVCWSPTTPPSGPVQQKWWPPVCRTILQCSSSSWMAGLSLSC